MFFILIKSAREGAQGRHEPHEKYLWSLLIHISPPKLRKTISKPLATLPASTIQSPHPAFLSPMKDIWLLHPQIVFQIIAT